MPGSLSTWAIEIFCKTAGIKAKFYYSFFIRYPGQMEFSFHPLIHSSSFRNISWWLTMGRALVRIRGYCWRTGIVTNRRTGTELGFFVCLFWRVFVFVLFFCYRSCSVNIHRWATKRTKDDWCLKGFRSWVLSTGTCFSSLAFNFQSCVLFQCVFPMERPTPMASPGTQTSEHLALWSVCCALVMSPSKSVRKSTAPIDTPANILKK